MSFGLFLSGCSLSNVLDEDSNPWKTAGSFLDSYLSEESGQEAGKKESGKNTAHGHDAEETEFRDGFLLKNPGHYGYDALNKKQKAWYREIEEILNRMDEDVPLEIESGKITLEDMEIEKVFQCVMMDHPELFFVDGYHYSIALVDEKLKEIRFSGTYTVDRAEAQKRLGEIEENADKILSGISEEASDYEKIRYIYDTVIRETDYDLNAEDNQNLYSVLVNHYSVCQGYSEAFQYLLLRLGIDCSVVHGNVNHGESHAWNLVMADGDYYYVDATWGDASYRNLSGQSRKEPAPFINYDYFCITTRELLRTHEITDEVEMPSCEAVQDNYYVKEGLLLDRFDMDAVKRIVQEALGEGKNSVSMKFSDQEIYAEMFDALIRESRIFECLPDDVEKIDYANNEKQYTLSFWIGA